MSKPVIIFILSAVFLGALIAFPYLTGDRASNNGHEAEEQEAPKGPHGGRLLEEGEFQIEVTIFERGVPPEYRLYAYEDGKPLDPASVTAEIRLARLGGRIDTFRFKKEGDYLRGDGVVEEPHSFDVAVTANYRGKNHRWEYPSYEGRTMMTEEGVRSSGIVMETAGPAKIHKVLELSGEVILNPDRQTHVLPRFDGIIASVNSHLGELVTRGQVLARLESMELAREKSEYLDAMHGLQFAQKAYEREQMLWDKKITSEQEYLTKKQEYDLARIRYQTAGQRLKAAGIASEGIETENNLATHFIQSPINGTVIEKDVAAGQAVQAEETLFVITDLSTVYAQIIIPAQFIKEVREGQPVTVVSDILQSEVRGRLTYVGPLLGEKTRSARGRVLIPNPEGTWKPGLFVKVHLVQEEVDVPLAVKAAGLQRFRDWDVVFLAVGNTFEVRPLELGLRDGEWVEVLSGLSAGDRYVAENSFLVKADIEKSGAKHDH